MDYILTFIEGVASFVSPCMLPMVPIYISYLAGKEDDNKRKALINSIGFVFGFTLVFLILSITTVSFSSAISNFINYAKYVFGAIIILFGLNYIGILKLNFLNKAKAINHGIKEMNFLKAILFGIIFSISWTPCVGTFLSSALLLIAKENDILKGVILILIYSLGLGIPFIISALLIEKLKSTFDFIKKHYKVIKIISGIVLIIMGIYIML